MILPERQIPSQQMSQLKVKISKVLAEIFGTKAPSGVEENFEAPEATADFDLEMPEPPKATANKSQSNDSKTPALDEIADFLAKKKVGGA